MQKWNWMRLTVAALAFGALVLGSLGWQDAVIAAAGTAGSTAPAKTYPKPTFLKKEIAKPVTEGKFKVVRGKLSLKDKDGKVHDLSLEVKQAKVKGEGDLLVSVTDQTANVSALTTIPAESSTATFSFKTVNMGVTFNPDESCTVEGRMLSMDDTAGLLVDRTVNESTAELFAGMTEALAIDPQVGLGALTGPGVYTCLFRKAYCMRVYGKSKCYGNCKDAPNNF